MNAKSEAALACTAIERADSILDESSRRGAEIVLRMGPSTYLSIKTWRESERGEECREEEAAAQPVMISRAVEDQMDHRRQRQRRRNFRPL